MFDRILVEERTRYKLEQYLSGQKDRCQNLILEGEKGIGKGLMAKEIAKWLLDLPQSAPLSLSPDYMEIQCKYPKVSIKEQTEHMLGFISYPSVKAERRVVVIDDAELMNQNLLLKVLEERTQLCIFILVAQGLLYETVYSRCFKVQITIPSRQQVESYLESQNIVPDGVLMNLSGGRMAYYESFQKKPDYRKKMQEFLQKLISMKNKREILEYSYCLKEKDPGCFHTLFDVEELQGFFYLVEEVFQAVLTRLSGSSHLHQWIDADELISLYGMNHCIEVLEVLKKHQKMLSRKGAYSKNNFFDFIMLLAEERSSL